MVLPLKDRERLLGLNQLFFLIHGLTATVVAFLTGFLQWDKQVPLYSHLPIERLIPDHKVLTTFSVGIFSPLFLALAAFNHFCCLYFHDYYLDNILNYRRNPIRWAEYSLSASLMHVHIAMLAGVYDVHLLWGIFGLSAVTMVFGYLAEPTDTYQRPSFRAFWFGFVPYLFMWTIIGCYFFTAVNRSPKPVPDFVWSILVIIFILDCAFAVALYCQLKEWSIFSSPLRAEVAFMLLSLVSKQLLCWINFGGTQSL